MVCALKSAALGAQTNRPKILGIASAAVAVTDYCAGVDFYSDIVGKTRGNQTDCPPPGQTTTHYGAGLRLMSGQQLDIGSFGTPNPYKLVNRFGFVTDDLPAMLEYLKSQGLDTMPGGKFGLISVEVQDPEGHQIVFIQNHEKPKIPSTAGSFDEAPRIIHVGPIVWNRGKMEHFYKDILGFHLYWQGGVTDTQTDWLDLQVPDGTDWIEFMLNVPENPDKQTLGIMNPIALGVPDVRAAAKELESKGMKLPESPEIGRDGKWQLNLYDPDGTRVELMEFTPVAKPCCSDYTGPHPKP